MHCKNTCLYKIGISQWPTNRLVDIKRSVNMEVDLLVEVECDQAATLEWQLHAIFRTQRRSFGKDGHTEWFELNIFDLIYLGFVLNVEIWPVACELF